MSDVVPDARDIQSEEVLVPKRAFEEGVSSGPGFAPYFSAPRYRKGDVWGEGSSRLALCVSLRKRREAVLFLLEKDFHAWHTTSLMEVAVHGLKNVEGMLKVVVRGLLAINIGYAEEKDRNLVCFDCSRCAAVRQRAKSVRLCSPNAKPILSSMPSTHQRLSKIKVVHMRTSSWGKWDASKCHVASLRMSSSLCASISEEGRKVVLVAEYAWSIVVFVCSRMARTSSA
jgi:hypothetical protein